MNNHRTEFSLETCGHIPHYSWDGTFLAGRHDRYDLQYVAGGDVRLEFKGKTFDLEAGSCWVNLPGIRYRYRPLKKGSDWDHRYVGFSGNISKFWLKMGMFPTGPCTISYKLDFPGRIDRIIELSSQNSLLNRLEMMNIIEKLLIDLKRSAEPESKQPKWFSGLLEDLKFPSSVKMDYNSLMRKYGISRRSLFRQFKTLTGLTPHEYHLKAKISYISEELETSDIPLKQLAEQAGYKDIFYFSKQFKHFTGLSPSQYRAGNTMGIRMRMPTPARPTGL